MVEGDAVLALFMIGLWVLTVWVISIAPSYSKEDYRHPEDTTDLF
jgi:hypothetical protein